MDAALRQRQLPQTLFFFALAISLASAGLIAWAFIQPPGRGASATLPASATTWSDMTLLYRLDGAIVRLEYQDPSNWTQTSAGTTQHLANGRYTTIESSIGVTTDVPASGPVAPQRWLHPEFEKVLRARHFVVVPSAQANTTTYQQVWTVPCGPIPDAVKPPECAGADAFQEVERFTLRTDITPPLVVAASAEVAGRVIWEYSVIEVSFGGQ